MQESVEYSLHLGSTPLFLAALAGHLGVVQILIQAAAQVDSLDATFWIDHSPFTPCFLHVNWTKVELLTLMLILSMGGAGVTGNGMMSVVQDSTNININDGMTPLMAAVEQSHTAIVQCLLQSHANVNGATSTLGATPLYIAATTGNNPMVYLLCEQKANVCKGLSHTGDGKSRDAFSFIFGGGEHRQ